MALELLDLHHRFGGFGRLGGHAALAGVSLRVERGDCYGFLGHNGAGKTTAMRIALGLLRPQRGSVRVDGHAKANELRARTRGIIEQAGFFRDATGCANLVRLARLGGIPARQAKREAARVLDVVGLSAHANKRAGAYSQGMRQRLGIAQALLGQPDYVLLDEPMNGLDPEGIAEVRALLRTLTCDAGCTVLLSSHQLHELEGLCNRVGILRQGQMLLEGDTATLLRGQQQRVQVENAERAHSVWQQMALSATRVDAGDESSGNGPTFAVDLCGKPPADVLAELVGAGARPTAFTPIRPSLESLYLQVTREGRKPMPARVPAVDSVATPPRAPAPLTSFARVLRYEGARLAHWPTLLLLALPSAFAAVRVFTRRAEVARDLARVRARELFSATDSSGYDALGLALQHATPMLAFVALGLGSQAIAGELAQGTLRNVLLRPLGRGTVLVGKLTAHCAAVLLAFAAAAGVAALLGACCLGFGDAAEVTRNGARTALIARADIAPHLWPALLHTLPALLCYAILGVALGTLARRPATALASACALGVSLDFARGVVPETTLPSSALPSPLRDTSHLRAFTDLAFGRADALFPDDTRALLVAAVWSLTAGLIAFLVFRRRAVP